MTELRSPLGYARGVARTVSWLMRNGIDTVHHNRANDWRPAEHLAARSCRIPLVTHFHTVNIDQAPATRMTTVIVAVAHFVARESAAQGVPVRVIHNSIDVARFSAGRDIRDELGIRGDATVLTFAGHIRRIIFAGAA